MAIDLDAAFEKFRDDYLKFELIESPLYPRKDICAFLLLDKLVPPKEVGRDMIQAAEHDIFFLDVDCEKLAEVATESDIQALSRCGVMFDSQYDSLSMFS